MTPASAPDHTDADVLRAAYQVIRRGAWTPDEIERLKQLRKNGLTNVAAARELGRTVDAVEWAITSRGLGRPRRMPRAVDQERASREHLADLVRAGHSPDQTELPIPGEQNPPMRFSSVLHVSGSGSPAAACAEHGS